MNILTPAIRTYIYSQEWPSGLQLDLYEEPGMVYIRFYLDNWLTLEPADHLRITQILKEVMENLRAQGVPIFMQRTESRSAT